MTEAGTGPGCGEQAPMEVEVLLATFNGERFLREQIDSILEQDWPQVRILARDDGSSDGTAGILAEYSGRLPDRFRCLTGSPTGSARGNFLELMKATTAEYVCFADQDDCWLPHKVRRSVEAMVALEKKHGKHLPLLVFSDLRVVDEELKTIALSMWKYAEIDWQSAGRLQRLFGQSVVTGCTAMINRPLLELAKRMPEVATMHDRWIALLAAAMGETAAIDEATVLYRQHGGNVIGAEAPDASLSGTVNRARSSVGRRLERWRSERMAEALLELHGAEMPERKAEVLRAYLRSGRSKSGVGRVALTLRYGFYRGRVLRNVALLLDLARGRSDDGEQGPA